jgi:hypothetical protein
MTSRLPFRAEFGVLPVTISSSIEFVRRIGKEEKCLFALAFEGSNSREKSEQGALFTNPVTSAQKKKNKGSAAVTFSSMSDSGTKAAQNRWQAV